MALLSNSEKLASVQAAIAAIESGAQEYEVGVQGNRRVKRGDLKTLYAREERLQQIVDAEGTGESMTSLGVYGGVE